MRFSYLQRPLALQNAVDAKYAELADQPVSDWTQDLVDGPYLLANFNEHTVILALVEERLKAGERTFYFLDAGAGFFTWGRYLSKFLTEQFRSPRFQQYGNFHCHIVSVSGEAHGETTGLKAQSGYAAEAKQRALHNRREIIQGIVEEDLTKHSEITRVLRGEYCTLYEFGNVKLENVQTILPQRLREVGAPVSSANLLDTFDFAISSSCLQHLVDGAGTLVQILDMLKIDGIAQFHGFGAGIPDPASSENLRNPSQVILANLGMPFFISSAYLHLPTCFVQKNISGAVDLPLAYDAEQVLDSKSPRANLIPAAGFKVPPFRACSARREEDFVATLDGLRFYHTLTQLALVEAPIAADHPWLARMQGWQADMFLRLSQIFESDINGIKESSPLLPSRAVQTVQHTQGFTPVFKR